MRNEGFDRDMFGFVVSLVGTVVCLLGAGLWSLIA